MFCIAYYASSHICYKVADYKKSFHLSWLQYVGVQPLSEEALSCLKAKSPMHLLSWLQRLNEEAYVACEVLFEARK